MGNGRLRIIPEIDDGGATSRLSRIRERHGLDKHWWNPAEAIPPRPIDVIISGDDIDLTSPTGGPALLFEGEVVLAYIRDHAWLRPRKRYAIERLRRVHFSACVTWKSMDAMGRGHRYRVTNSDRDEYTIDISGGHSIDVALLPCQNCLEETDYRCWREMSPGARDRLKQDFSAREALSLMREQFALFGEQTRGHQAALWPTGYPKNWKRVSEAAKERAGHICEECGDRGPLHTHHIDSDKANIERRNLQVLCRPCHARKHPHMRWP